jgi:predicted transcriptional regulator of viral defense system
MNHDTDTLPASRARLASVLRASKEVVSVGVASTTLGIERSDAAKLLSRWRAQGWLRRIGHGLYVPVPLDLAGSEQVVADSWVLVPSLRSLVTVTSVAGQPPIIGNSPSSSSTKF